MCISKIQSIPTREAICATNSARNEHFSSPNCARTSLFGYRRIVMSRFDQTIEDLDVVNDLEVRPGRIVLVCESPHKHEIRSEFPLAGSAGRNVTRGLSEGFDRKSRFANQPIGKIIKRLSVNECFFDVPDFFSHLGLMNVSRIPMQKSAYSSNLNLQSQWSMLFNGFRTLRTNPKAETRKNDCVQYIEKSMVADFRRRLCKLKGDTSIVLCGTVARAYFRKAGGPEMGLCVYSPKVSHPSARRMNNTWLAHSGESDQ